MSLKDKEFDHTKDIHFLLLQLKEIDSHKAIQQIFPSFDQKHFILLI